VIDKFSILVIQTTRRLSIIRTNVAGYEKNNVVSYDNVNIKYEYEKEAKRCVMNGCRKYKTFKQCLQ